MTRYTFCLTAISTLAVATACPGVAMAADPVREAPVSASSGSADIIITATRREQALKEVPAAVSVLGGDDLGRQRIDNVNALNAMVPSLQVNRNNSNIAFTIRGMGSQFRSEGTDNSIAFHQNGVYIARPAAATGGFFDVERIEVLRGPQGTLYGRNATAGAINVISRMPTADLDGYLSASTGNYGALDFEGVIGGPLAGDDLLFRVGAYTRNRFNGFGKNLTTGDEIDDLHEWGGRITLAWQPADNFSAVLRGDYYGADDNAYGVLLLGAAPNRTPIGFNADGRPATLGEILGGYLPDNPRDSTANIPTGRTVDDLSTSLELSVDANDWLNFKSLTAYRDHRSTLITDFDQTSRNLAIFATTVHAKQFSQELTANINTDRLNALVGLFYFHEDAYSNLDAPFPGLAVPPGATGLYIQRGTIDTKAYAAFANIEYEILDGLKLGAGLRYNRETKKNDGEFSGIYTPLTAFDGSQTWKGTTPRFTISYEPVQDVNLYATIGRGFKSGQWLIGQPIAVNPETVWAYEAGLRTRIGGWNSSIAGFYYDYKDLQIQRIQNGLQILQNTPGARIYGAEWENRIAFGHGFTINAAATLLSTEIRGFMSQNPNLPGIAVPGQPNTPDPAVQDLSGNRLPYAPKFTLLAGFEKVFDWGATSGTLRGSWNYTSDTYLDIFNDRLNSFRPRYSLFDASYEHRFDDANLSVTIWGKNLSDKRVVMNSNVSIGTLGNPEFVNFNPPRTFGITAKYDIR